MTMPQVRVNRRDLLAGGAAVGSAIAASTHTIQAKSISGEMPWAPGIANAPEPISPGEHRFFSADEASFVDAAISRLIPNDDLGPGAKEVGVTTFIDRQLAGPFGAAQSWYMNGPWADGTPSQGFQSRLSPADLYRAAIKAIDKYCRQSFSDKTFAQLGSNEQDQVLGGLEKGDLKLDGVNGKTFFEIFLQNTTEGFFSDPIYGGNRDMAGWNLIGFPGARYDYRPYVGRHGERLNLPPVGLKGRSEWRVKK